jgi:hypothetical protein
VVVVVDVGRGVVVVVDVGRGVVDVGRHADNVLIPPDLTQLFCPGFTLAAGPPSGFTTDIVGCWGGALWRACNLTAFTHSSPGPVVQRLLRFMRDRGSILRGVHM